MTARMWGKSVLGQHIEKPFVILKSHTRVVRTPHLSL